MSYTNAVNSFVRQSSDPSDRMCGAYSLAYYKWLTAGKTASGDEKADRAEVMDIYRRLQFGPGYAGVAVTGLGKRDFSPDNNPVKMLDYAVCFLGAAGARFFYDGGSQAMNDIKLAIENNDSLLIKQFSDRIVPSGIPPLEERQYAVALFLVTVDLRESGGLHWILFHKGPRGLEYYDPYFGVPKKAEDSHLRGNLPLPAEYSGEKRMLAAQNSCLLLSM